MVTPAACFAGQRRSFTAEQGLPAALVHVAMRSAVESALHRELAPRMCVTRANMHISGGVSATADACSGVVLYGVETGGEADLGIRVHAAML